jgi:hypothetical protein
MVYGVCGGYKSRGKNTYYAVRRTQHNEDNYRQKQNVETVCVLPHSRVHCQKYCLSGSRPDSRSSSTNVCVFAEALFPKIARTAFLPLALIAFRDISSPPFFKQRLHRYFSAAGAQEFLGGYQGARVLAAGYSFTARCSHINLRS